MGLLAEVFLNKEKGATIIHDPESFGIRSSLKNLVDRL